MTSQGTQGSVGETPWSRAQLPIALGQKLHPASPLYNMAFAMVIEGELDPALFDRAWLRVLDAHPILRTSYPEEAGEARVREASELSTIREELAGERLGVEEFHLDCRKRAGRTLPLAGPLVDSFLVPLSGGRTGWYLNQHHLITDAWSTQILFRQVGEAYAALRDEAEEPALILTLYADVARREPAAVTAKPSGEPAWRARPIEFYGKRHERSDTRNVRVKFELDEVQTSALEAIGRERGFATLNPDLSRFTVYSTLLTAWLHRISGQREIGFETPLAGRSTPEAKVTPGLFIEMRPVQVAVEPGMSFRELGIRCLEESYRLLKTAANEPRAADSYNVVLNYVPGHFGTFAGQSTSVEWIHPGHADSIHSLRLQVHDLSASGRLQLHFDFDAEAFPEGLRERAIGHFSALCDALLESADTPVDTVDLASREERSQLKKFGAGANADLPRQTVVESFREIAAREAGSVALRQGEQEISFGELQERVDALSAGLLVRGVESGDRVAVSARRSIEAVIAILAILQVRAAFVPIDPAYPEARRHFMLEDSGARLVLVDSVDRSEQGPNESILIAEEVKANRGAPFERLKGELDDLAYLIYTSGSTGQPKGVMVEHGGLSSYLEWAESLYVRGEKLTFALFTSLSFDLTVTSFFLPLITGGTTVIYPESEGPVDSAILDVATENTVDFIKLTPSHLSILRRFGCESSRIRRMVVGGEDFKMELASAIHAQFDGRVEIYNEYGPTEAVVGCISHRFDPVGDSAVSVPIGTPAAHVEALVLNESQTAVPLGTPGELWIARYGLARGYHGLEDLTSERFRSIGGNRAKRWYRTGDRVRIDDAGCFHYLGRIDRQVKISGHRIELGEVEAAITTVPGVVEAAVLMTGEEGSSGEVEAQLCVRCGLPSNYPRSSFDQDGVCTVCRTYDATKEYARGYFKDLEDLKALFDESRAGHSGQYDCMMLLSGGKDSSYALAQLVDLGLSVYAYTLDNGYISEGAKENVRKVTEQLGVPVEFGMTPAMNDIFKDSLERYSNVCHGCFKTIYTLSTNRALELGIPIIVTGLSRGQMFETRLTEETFRDGLVKAEEVDAAVLAARKVYHRIDDAVSRSLDVTAFQDDAVFDRVQFVDFYRYTDVGLEELYAYLGKKIPWVRPADTGRSTNCLINDIGIYVHKKERGYHNYALPYSWDVRMGHKTRDEARAELEDEIDLDYVEQVLGEIDYEPRSGSDSRAQGAALMGYYVAAEADFDEAKLQARLEELLPSAWIPTVWSRVESLPLTTNGKVDEAALRATGSARSQRANYAAPEGPIEEFIAECWEAELRTGRVGRDDHFFELGGASITAMKAMIRLNREFDIALPLATLFSSPTVRELGRVTEDWILREVDDMTQEERARLLKEGSGRPEDVAGDIPWL